jgi:FAD/FMN-containing dehydrogenase
MFREALPPDRIEDDPAARRLAASDIAAEAAILPACVLRPVAEAEVAALARIAARERIALHPRGGGWSYTGGFAPQASRSAIVDTTGLAGITIDRERGIARVGAGVTWDGLDRALAAHDLRAASFGPLSGLGARVGATVAQNGGFFGAAGYGAVAERTVAGARLVDGLGDVRELTDSDRIDAICAPQPLAGDCGAFGVKTALDIRIVPRPAVTLFASFAFPDSASASRAIASLVGLPGLGEVFAFDEGIHANLAATGFSVLEAAGIAGDLARSGRGWFDRLGGLVRTARAGKAFLHDIPWSLHVSIDGEARPSEDMRLEVGRRAAVAGGDPIPDVIPRVTRAKPFRPIKALLGPAGERWLPCHGLVPAAEAGESIAALTAVLRASAPERAQHGVRSGFLLALLGGRVTIEPQLFWPDALTPYLRAMAQPDQVARFGSAPANESGRRLAGELRGALVAIMDDRGAGHFQIGRTYAARPGVPAGTVEAWRQLKRRYDPHGIMNPGALGL